MTTTDALPPADRLSPALAWLLGVTALALPVGGLLLVPLVWRLSVALSAVLGVLGGAAGVVAAVIVWQGARGGEGAAPLARGAGAWGMAGLALWVVAGGVSSMLADRPIEALHAWATASALAVMVGAWMALLLAAARDSDGGARTLRPVVRLLLAAEAVYLAQALPLGLVGFNLVEWLFASAQASEERGAFLTLAGHPNYLGSALVGFFFLKLGAVRGLEYPRVVAVAFGVADLAALGAIGSRGATLAIVVGVAVWAVLRATVGVDGAAGVRRRRLVWGAVAFVVLLALLTVGARLMSGSPSRPGASSPGQSNPGQSLAARLFDRDPVTTRVHSYLTAVHLFALHPLLGVGPGRFGSAHWHLLAGLEREASSEGAERAMLVSPFLVEKLAATTPTHAHNELLHAAAERGLPGVFGLMLAWVAATAGAVGARRFVLAGALAAVAVDAQFAFPLHTAASVFLNSLLLGAAFTAERSGGDTAPAIASPRASRLHGAALMLVAVALIAATALQTLSIIVARSARPGATTPPPGDAPVDVGAQRFAAALWPGNVAARRSLLYAFLGKGGEVQALELAQDVAAQTGDPLDLLWLAKAQLTRRDLGGAIDTLRIAAPLDPSRQAPAIYLAHAEFSRWEADRKRDTAGLFEALDRLRRLNHRSPLIAVADGLMAEEAGAREAALGIYRRGLENAALPGGGAELTPADAVEVALLEGQYAKILAQRASSLAAALGLAAPESAPVGDAPPPATP